MLKLKSDLFNPTKTTAIPSAAGRSYNVTKILFELMCSHCSNTT